MASTFHRKLRLAFDPLPGFWGYKDDASVFMYASEAYGKLVGLGHHLDVVGRTDLDMPCQSSACGELFRAQDWQVIRSGKPMTILDIHPFAGGDWRAFLVTKMPLRNENHDVIGTLFHGRDITSPRTIELGSLLGRMHVDASSMVSLSQGSYLIDESGGADSLTKRESEVLFFLVRGKSLPEIANLLALSHENVERCVDGIEGKWHVHSKSELIEAAISCGYGHRIPKSLFSRRLSVALRRS